MRPSGAASIPAQFPTCLQKMVRSGAMCQFKKIDAGRGRWREGCLESSPPCAALEGWPIQSNRQPTVGGPAVKTEEDENAGAGSTLREEIDTVKAAQKFLLAHPEACKQPAHGELPVKKHGHAQGCEHGKAPCITAFLGKENWSLPKVKRILHAGENLEPFVISHTAPTGTTHPGRQQQSHGGIPVRFRLTVSQNPSWGKVVVDGQQVFYGAFTLPGGTINVGTYTVGAP
jgi:hypothetical protein